MPCEQYREALADAAAGLWASAGLEAHLGSCEACREELQMRRRALAVADAEMADLLAAEPSPGLAARIREAVSGTRDLSPRAPVPAGARVAEPVLPSWRFGWLWPVTAAAVALLVATALWVGRGAPTPEPRVARDEHRPPPEASPRATEPAAGPGVSGARRTAPLAGGRDRVTPRSRGQAARRGVLSPGGSPGTRHAAVPRDRRAPEPEVLVPTGETEALLRFAAHLQTRLVSPDSLLVADLSAPLADPQGVEIQSLVIVPLDPAETPGTD
jgi:hypothetical protein